MKIVMQNRRMGTMLPVSVYKSVPRFIDVYSNPAALLGRRFLIENIYTLLRTIFTRKPTRPLHQKTTHHNQAGQPLVVRYLLNPDHFRPKQSHSVQMFPCGLLFRSLHSISVHERFLRRSLQSRIPVYTAFLGKNRMSQSPGSPMIRQTICSGRNQQININRKVFNIVPSKTRTTIQSQLLLVRPLSLSHF